MKNKVIQYVIKVKNDASKGLDGFAKKLGVSKGALLGLGAAAAVAATAVVVAFKKIMDIGKQVVQEMADIGDSFDKMSLRTNVDVSNLAEWGFILERAGGQVNDLETAVRRMSKSMNDYQRGLSTAVDAWDALGVAPTNHAGELKDINEVLWEMADALPAITNKAERMAIAQEVLGRGGLKMAAMFANGSEEIRRQIGIFDEINAEMSIEFTQGAAKVIDAQTDLKWAIRGLKADLTEPLQPVIAEVIDEMAFAVGDFGHWVSANKDDVREFARALGDIAVGTVKTTKALASLLEGPAPEVLLFLAKVTPLTRAIGQDFKYLQWIIDNLADASGEAQRRAIELQTIVHDMPDPATLGPFEMDTEDVISGPRAALLAEAKALGIEVYETLFNPATGAYETIQRASDAIAKDLTTKLNESLKAKIAEAPVIPKELLAVPMDTDAMDSGLMLLDDIIAAEAERIAQLKEAWQDVDIFNANGMMSPEDYARLQEAADKWEEQVQQRREDAEQAEEDAIARQEAMGDAVSDVSRNFERLAADSIKAMLSGKGGAIAFGDALRTIVIDALSAVIAKLLVIQALSLASGFGGGGGGASAASLARFAFGGTVPGLPGAALGYAVPDGPRGMDSRLVKAMPGEEIIRRSLSQRLDRFLVSSEQAAMVSPFDLDYGGGRGGGTALTVQVARPMSYLDALDLGEHAAVAAKIVKEAEL